MINIPFRLVKTPKEQVWKLNFYLNLTNFRESIFRNPDTYSYYEKPVRQGTLNRFPFTIVYELFQETIVVYSVFMYKQNPDKKRTG